MRKIHDRDGGSTPIRGKSVARLSTIPPLRLVLFVSLFGLSYFLLIAALVYGISQSSG